MSPASVGMPWPARTPRGCPAGRARNGRPACRCGTSRVGELAPDASVDRRSACLRCRVSARSDPGPAHGGRPVAKAVRSAVVVGRATGPRTDPHRRRVTPRHVADSCGSLSPRRPGLRDASRGTRRRWIRCRAPPRDRSAPAPGRPALPTPRSDADQRPATADGRRLSEGSRRGQRGEVIVSLACGHRIGIPLAVTHRSRLAVLRPRPRLPAQPGPAVEHDSVVRDASGYGTASPTRPDIAGTVARCRRPTSASASRSSRAKRAHARAGHVRAKSAASDAQASSTSNYGSKPSTSSRQVRADRLREELEHDVAERPAAERRMRCPARRRGRSSRGRGGRRAPASSKQRAKNRR